ncbi:MAG: nitroreductase family protein [Alistipes sp.]
MPITITINSATCIRCGKCVKVCSSLILTQATDKQVLPVNIDTCNSCGHCVAVCPTSSVLHSDFPLETVHPVDRTLLPTPEQMMLLCKTRRSNRAFSTTPIPAAYLQQILEAAHRAPTARNLQQISFTVITDPEKLRQISKFTLDTFASIAKKLENPLLRPILKRVVPSAYALLPAFHRLLREAAAGNDLILRKATAVIFIHAPKENQFGVLDANLAYQNGSLMAETLGVSQFYTGFVYTAIKRDKKQQLAKSLGIDGIIHAGMALGMPAFTFPNYIDRKPIEVQR